MRKEGETRESGHEALGVLTEAAGSRNAVLPPPTLSTRPPTQKSPASHFGKRGFVSS